MSNQSQSNPPGDAIVIDPKPLFDLSPSLYMQFMEPLGVTDASVEAAWNYDTGDWRADFVQATRDLAPGMIRFGGLLSRYYKWREGVGPIGERRAYRNYVWGGKEAHCCGTHEFVDLCRRVAAEPLYCVNFLADGRQHYRTTPQGDRTGDATEAADWVSYANDPDNLERKSHGVHEPYKIKYWQLGNETNYGSGGFSREQCITHTIEFAKAMRSRDPSLKIIGWGDTPGGRWGNDEGEPWAGDLVRQAGEHIDYIALHMMAQWPIRKDSALTGLRYQDDPRAAWDELMEMSRRIDAQLRLFETTLDAAGSKHPLAVTEGHLSLSPRNMNPILTEWLTGVYHARAMNTYERHGGRVKIATIADFCGNRWTTNALMIQAPHGISYLLPAGAVMRLFRRHGGKQGVAVRCSPPGLDIAASRTANKVYLHVANTEYASAIPAAFAVNGLTITAGRVHQISPASPRQAIHEAEPRALDPVEHDLLPGQRFRWTFPARSVSAVELVCET